MNLDSPIEWSRRIHRSLNTHTEPGNTIHAVQSSRGHSENRLAVHSLSLPLIRASNGSLHTSLRGTEHESDGWSDGLEQCQRHVVGIDKSKDLVLSVAYLACQRRLLTLMSPGRACLAASTFILTSGSLQGSTPTRSPNSLTTLRLRGLPFVDQEKRPKLPPKMALSMVGALRWPSKPNISACVSANLPP